MHQSWDRETEEQLLSQGHQTAKQPSLTQRGCCLHGDPITGHFNKWITSHFKQCHFNNVYMSYVTHIICIYCILYHLLHLDYAARPSLIHIFMYLFSFTPLDLCVLGSCCEIVKITCYLLVHCQKLEAQAFHYTLINIC